MTEFDEAVRLEQSEHDQIESMRFRPDFPSDQKRTFAALLFAKGMGYRTVAKVLGLSIYTVRDWSKKYAQGNFSEKLTEKQYRYDEAFKAKVIALRREGLSWSELKKRTGISPATCKKWMLRSESPTNGAND